MVETPIEVNGEPNSLPSAGTDQAGNSRNKMGIPHKDSRLPHCGSIGEWVGLHQDVWVPGASHPLHDADSRFRLGLTDLF